MEQLERIQTMEAILERAEEVLPALQQALEEFRALEPELDRLEAYYTGPLWWEDLAADEAGRLPPELRRGILSEDGIWNLLAERDSLLGQLNGNKKEPDNRPVQGE